MEEIWTKLYAAAKDVQNFRQISNYVSCGEVSAAIESSSGNIYTGICVDTACSLGLCAERNAIFNMLTNGDNKIKRILAILPDGKTGAPCGACRELIAQIMPDEFENIEIMLDYDTNNIILFKDLMPYTWLK